MFNMHRKIGHSSKSSLRSRALGVKHNWYSTAINFGWMSKRKRQEEIITDY